MSDFRFWKRGLFLDSRLRSTIALCCAELEHRVGESEETHAHDKAKAARDLYGMAEAAWWEGDSEHGWRCLHDAQLHQLQFLGDAEIEVRVAEARAECEKKLGKWRRASVTAALDKAKDAPRQEKLRLLSTALRHRNEHFNNMWHKIRRYQRRVTLSGLFLGAIVLVMLCLEWWGLIVFEGVGRTILLPGFLAGTLGGFLSLLLPLRSGGKTIPEDVQEGINWLTRPVIGGTLGMIAAVAATSHVLGLTTDSAGAEIPIAFAAGFSERLVIGRISALVAEEKQPDSKDCPKEEAPTKS